MNLNEASAKAYEIAVKRNQYKGDGKDTIRALKYCAGEVVEATEALAKESLSLNDFSDELADIVICVLSVCGYNLIDIEGAIARKMLINEGRAENDSKK